jgi:dCTP deaminase
LFGLSFQLKAERKKMILTGEEILAAVQMEDIRIEPFNKSQLNPNSYDLRLSRHVMRYKDPVLDAKLELETEEFLIQEEGILLLPGELYLMATAETTSTYKHVPIIEGRSSIGRLGVNIHATAGFGDIGFSGTWTLEVSVVRPVRIYAGMRFCQVYFTKCNSTDPQSWYDGKYLGQIKPRASKIWAEAHEWYR